MKPSRLSTAIGPLVLAAATVFIAFASIGFAQVLNALPESGRRHLETEHRQIDMGPWPSAQESDARHRSPR